MPAPNQPLQQTAAATLVSQGSTRHGVRVSPVELLLILKFLVATSPWRDVADRKQDVADLAAHPSRSSQA